MKKLAILAITTLTLMGAYLSKASAAQITVQSNWGISHAARAAGCSDWSSESRWQAIARQNGASDWRAFNSSIYPGQLITVNCGTSGNTYRAVVPVYLTSVQTINTWPVINNQGIVTQYMHAGHNGVDIASNASPLLVAIGNGTVIERGWNVFGGGYVVKIRLDNGIQVLYAHTRGDYRILLNQRVTKGQVLATMGATGNATGIHVHFETWSNGTALNPMSFISR